jgi:Icc-related predicted phosphoesterase
MKKLFAVVFSLCFSICCFAQGRINIKHGPYLQNLKETEVTIVWVASEPSIGWVELAPDDNTSFYLQERPKYFNVTNGVKNTSSVHVVKLTGLTPGTKYRYRIYSQEVLEHRDTEITYGRVAATNVYTVEPLSFTTNDRNKPETSFIMINDIHGRAEDIPPMLKVSDYKNTDMVIFNGDMLSQLHDESGLFSGFMDISIELFAKVIPMYYARGNHETRGPFATTFQQYFSPKEPHLYYLVRQGPVCFVVLDTGEDKPDSDIEYSGITDYDNYRTEQAKWLAEAVKSKDFTEAKFKVVIAHMPPVTGRAIWHGQKEVLEKFVPILNQANVDVMLCAHLHRNLNIKPDSDIKFPMIVNAHKTVLKGTTKNNQLTLVINDLDGKVVDQVVLNAK